MNSQLTHWAKWEQIDHKLSTNSQFACHVRPPLPPVYACQADTAAVKKEILLFIGEAFRDVSIPAHLEKSQRGLANPDTAALILLQSQWDAFRENETKCGCSVLFLCLSTE